MPPKGDTTRPATDRIRESLFAILEPDLSDARVLDLFAGAGTLGIEALSRGALFATFVERAKDAIAAVRTNLRATGFEDRTEIVATNVLAFLDQPIATPYDVVFVDPPFADVDVHESVLGRLSLSGAVHRDTIVVARVLRKHRPTLPTGVTVTRVKEIGEEDLLFLRYDGAGGGG